MARSFVYRARDRQGNGVRGIVRAETERAAAHYIRAKGYYVTRVKEQRAGAGLTGRWNALQGVAAKDIAVFCRQMALMLQAGLPLITILGILCEQSSNPKLKQALHEICSQVRQGDTLTDAMRGCGNVFPSIMLQMIKVGEVSGTLDEVLVSLAAYLEKEYRVKEKITSALIYPVIVSAAAVAATAVILLFVMPVFVTLFENMRLELPLPTKLLLAASTICQEYVVFFPVIVIAIFTIFKYLYALPRYRMAIERILLSLPIGGALLKKAFTARFARVLALLLSSGVPIVTALEVMKDVSDNMVLSHVLDKARGVIQNGSTLSGALAAEHLFEPMVIQMLAVGEETGCMDTLLLKIADFYEAELEDMAARLGSLLEPLLIAVLGVVVSGILVAVVLPIFDSIAHVSG